MTPKQYKALENAIYTLSCNVFFVGMLISVQLSGWDSWESIWLTVATGVGVLGAFVRNLRA